MSRKKTIRSLLAAAGKLPGYRDRRAQWVRGTSAAWREAQRAMDERCMAAVERLSEEEFERLCDEEEAKVEAFRGPLKTAAEKDLWPRHLYFGDI